jgi:hypothetical protein
MVGTLGCNFGCCMRSRHRHCGSGRRHVVWASRSNRGGRGRSREGRGGSGRGHVVRTLWSDGVRRAGPWISGESIRPGNLGWYSCRAIIHKRRRDARPRGRIGDVVWLAVGRGRPWRAFADAGRREAGPARRFPRDARSGRRGMSRRSRIKFVGKARELPDVGKIPRCSVQCAHGQWVTWRIHACSHDTYPPRHLRSFRWHLR